MGYMGRYDTNGAKGAEQPTREYFIREVEDILTTVETISETEKSYLQSMLSDLNMREALLVLKDVIIEAKNREQELHRAALS